MHCRNETPHISIVIEHLAESYKTMSSCVCSSKSRKKKGQNDSSSDLNTSQQSEGASDLDTTLAPKTDEFPDPDQKNGIGAAGTTLGEEFDITYS